MSLNESFGFFVVVVVAASEEVRGMFVAVFWRGIQTTCFIGGNHNHSSSPGGGQEARLK